MSLSRIANRHCTRDGMFPARQRSPSTWHHADKTRTALPAKFVLLSQPGKIASSSFLNIRRSNSLCCIATELGGTHAGKSGPRNDAKVWFLQISKPSVGQTGIIAQAGGIA